MQAFFTEPTICERIRNLLRPSCKSVPVAVHLYSDETIIVWKNGQTYKQTYKSKICLVSMRMLKDRIEMIFSCNDQYIGSIKVFYCELG